MARGGRAVRRRGGRCRRRSPRGRGPLRRWRTWPRSLRGRRGIGRVRTITVSLWYEGGGGGRGGLTKSRSLSA